MNFPPPPVLPPSDRLAEGMRELETILDTRDVVLCAPLLLIYAHKRCKTIGKRHTTASYAWTSLKRDLGMRLHCTLNPDIFAVNFLQ